MSSGRPKATAKKVQGASKSIWYKWFIQSDFSENKKNMHPSRDFRAIFSIVWRAFRQSSFKFIAGESLKVADMSRHSAQWPEVINV